MRLIQLKKAFGVTAAAVVLCGVVAGPASADPDNLPILYASKGQEAHACVVIGHDAYYEGVVCSDILTSETTIGSNPGYSATGRTEVYCQTYSATPVVVQCDGAQTVTELENGVDSVPWDESPGFTCGDLGDYTTPACSTGRNYAYSGGSTSYTSLSGTCATNLASTDQVYNVAFGEQRGTYTDLWLTEIVFPDGDYTLMPTADDGSNQNSGHYFICP